MIQDVKHTGSTVQLNTWLFSCTPAIYKTRPYKRLTSLTHLYRRTFHLLLPSELAALETHVTALPQVTDKTLIRTT